MFDYQLGDLVVLLETVECEGLVGIKGEICIITKIYDRTSMDDGIFFDYKICTADGVSIEVWNGEIKKLDKDEI